MTVRELMYGLVSNDPVLNGLHLNQSTLYANFGADSPQHDFFAVLRWGGEVTTLTAQRGRLKVTERSCSLWVYDRQPTYDRINDAIKRWCEIMDALEARRTGDGTYDGFISSTYWEGDGDDAYDDALERYTKSSTYTIIASGD